jgi:hypothetical protein
MIELHINKKEVKIPSARELTVKQYIAYFKKWEEKMHPLKELIIYLSVVLKISKNKTANFKTNNSMQLLKRIGNIEDYTKIKPNEYLLGYKLDAISTIGQKLMIEENGSSLKDEELMVFILAVAMVKIPNIDKVNEIKDKMMDMKYLDVLPSAFFLLKNFLKNKKKETKHLNRSIFQTKIMRSRNRLVLTN